MGEATFTALRLNDPPRATLGRGRVHPEVALNTDAMAQEVL